MYRGRHRRREVPESVQPALLRRARRAGAAGCAGIVVGGSDPITPETAQRSYT